MARRHQPPVVIQTSILDCGPATLSALLTGLGSPAAYDELRSLCATDVDGTSINALEQVARWAGVDAEQMVLPAENVLASPDEYLPAIAVIQLPDGFPHFVLAWRRTRRGVLLMDPASGVRRVSAREFVDMLYRYTLTVPGTAWREWAGSDVFTTALRTRMARIGLRARQQEQLLCPALADLSPRGLAVLDGALREVERGEQPRSALNTQRLDNLDWDHHGRFAITPAEGDLVDMRGAVIVRARNFSPDKADPVVAARLAVPTPTPLRTARRLLGHPVRWIAPIVVFALVSTGITVGKNLTLQPLVNGVGQHIGTKLIVIICIAVLAGVLAYGSTYRAGRVLDARIRAAWWELIGALPDSFTRTRPTSDATERGHLLHRVREIPVYLVRLFLSLGTIIAGCATMAAVVPRTLPFAAALVVVMLAIPAFAFRRIAEADLQARTISGALARFTLDSILGGEAVLAANAAPALRTEQDASQRAWLRAQTRFIWRNASLRASLGPLGALLAAGAIATAHTSTGHTLLVAVVAGLVVDGGVFLTDTLRSLAEARSSLARAAGPLATQREAPPTQQTITTSRDLTLDGVSVRIGAATVLDGIDLTIPARAKVAVVGHSGSGKSSLAAVLLGWLEPTAGTVHWGGGRVPWTDLRKSTAWSAPETRLWNDDLLGNVRYGTPIGDDTAEARLRQAEAEAIAARLQAREDQRLGDAGTALSDGEAQRVRFARALGRPTAPLVVLDEPFRGLERFRRRRLLELALHEWAASTVVCVTHDLAETDLFDLVIVMADGRVGEMGSPAELAARDGGLLSRLREAEAGDRFAGYERVEVGES